MQLIMHKALRQAINDLDALRKLAHREDAERIQKIIERLQTLSEQNDKQENVCLKLIT
jgi:anion-transporting  ArsA/GET3 family ATPase